MDRNAQPLPNQAPRLISSLAALFAAQTETAAVGLGGSRIGTMTDAASDIDLYVLTRGGEIPLATRRAIVEQISGASRADLGLTYWGTGDEWIDAVTGIEVDVVYFDIDWLAGEVRRVLGDHSAALGYTTCFWHTVRSLRLLYDRDGRLAALQAEADAPYPEPLRRNIIALNRPVLRDIIPSYTTQIEKVVKRGDRVSVNHRLAALLASYFDILFAFNRVPHPGEKRLVARAEALCPRLPDGMAVDLASILAASGTADSSVMVHLHRLLDRLDKLLAADATLEVEVMADLHLHGASRLELC